MTKIRFPLSCTIPEDTIDLLSAVTNRLSQEAGLKISKSEVVELAIHYVKNKPFMELIKNRDA